MAMTLKPIKFYKTPLLGVFVLCLLGGAIMPAQAQQTSAAAAEIRFQQMEKEIRRLTGQMEEQQYEIRRLREELDKVQGLLDTAQSSGAAIGDRNAPTIESAATLSDADKAGAPTGNQQNNTGSFKYNPPSDPAATQTLGTLNTSPQTGTVANVEGGAARAYDTAYSYIKSRDFDRAEAEFANFIKNYPDHDLVSNAKYWYGETFYVRGDYNQAARVFAEGYQKYPDGAKAASNLLKLGMSLVGMGKKDDACIAFKQLKKDYSKSSIPVLKRADSEMEKIGCS
tara:strand:- start:29986 stop:30834 length:849 start_codon:yes stop_codon:yes gene_type:complete